jgi:hypothetical protein
MILGILTKWGTHHASYGKIEAGRTELTFIVAIRAEVYDFRVLGGGSEDISENPIDLRISTSTLLVSKASLIPYAGDHNSVLDRRNTCFV